MKNRLSDLNNHLFAQMERLADEDLTQECIGKEAQRAAAMVDISDQILRRADLQLRAARLFADNGADILPMLPQIWDTKK